MSGNLSREDSMAGSSNNLQASLLLRLALVPGCRLDPRLDISVQPRLSDSRVVSRVRDFYMIIYSFKATIPTDREDAASPFDLALKVTYIILYLLKQS